MQARSRLREHCLFLRMLAFAATLRLLVRLPPSRLAAWMERVRVAPLRDEGGIAAVRAQCDAVLRHGPPLVRRGCLTRGLTLYRFLRRAGLDVQLVFGMGRPRGGFMGHCWLVMDGVPYLEPRDPRPLYAELYRIPRREVTR